MDIQIKQSPTYKQRSLNLWTKEEDELLIHLTSKLNRKWIKISKEIPQRNAN